MRERLRSMNLSPYRTRVGDVTGIAAMVNRTAADVHQVADLPEWDLALSLVDRDPQAEVLSDSLNGLMRDPAARALLVVLPGVNLDCHKYFLARCVTWDLQEKTGREWVNLGTLSWPAGVRLSSVIRVIGETLDAPGMSDLGSLNKKLGADGPCVCFSHVVDGEHWRCDAGGTLTEWGKIFVDRQLQLHPTRFLLAFLCLQLRIKRTDYCKALEKMVSNWVEEAAAAAAPQTPVPRSAAAAPVKLAPAPRPPSPASDAPAPSLPTPAAVEPANAVRNPRIVVMPPLGKVRQTHLETWTTTASKRLRRNLEFQFQVEINRIFTQDEERFMNDVIEALQQPLRMAFGEVPSVAVRR